MNDHALYGLCLDCYYVAVSFDHVFEKFKWYWYLFVYHYGHLCLLTFFVILEEMRQAASASSLL